MFGLTQDFTPHSLRHGGCTYAHSVLKMSPDQIMVRGRWAATSSFTHYLQQHAAALINLRLPASISRVCGLLDTHSAVAIRSALRLATAADQVVARVGLGRRRLDQSSTEWVRASWR